MSQPTWMLYGANGYTGELIADATLTTDLPPPILAGRREEAIRPIADRTGYEMRVFDLSEVRAIKQAIHDVDLVLHCAGPFIHTSPPMVEACLQLGKHYLDITGEIDVFENCHSHHRRALKQGSVILPGVGFDVVPTDCLAATLAAQMPKAIFLELAFHSSSSMSRGTLKTALENISKGGRYRWNGMIRDFDLGDDEFIRPIPFRDKPRQGVAIPWGDVSSAYYSTDIPNIVVYNALPPSVSRALKITSKLSPVAGFQPLLDLIGKQIDRRVEGPSEEQRESVEVQLWGRVRDEDGLSLEATLVTPEGYKLTVMTALEATRRVLEGDVEPGAQTPSLAFGADFITHFEGCDLEL